MDLDYCAGCDPDQHDHNIGCPMRTGEPRESEPWIVYHQCGWCGEVTKHPCAEATRLYAEGSISKSEGSD